MLKYVSEQIIHCPSFIRSNPIGVTLKLYDDVLSHTQLTLLLLFIIWQQVSTSSIGHCQAVVQEHERIQKRGTIR